MKITQRIKEFSVRRKIRKYIKKWQRDIGYIEGEIKNHDISTGGNEGALHWGIKLSSLIYTLIKENKKKTAAEIKKIAEENKLSNSAENYLKQMMEYLKLLK